MFLRDTNEGEQLNSSRWRVAGLKHKMGWDGEFWNLYLPSRHPWVCVGRPDRGRDQRSEGLVFQISHSNRAFRKPHQEITPRLHGAKCQIDTASAVQKLEFCGF